MDLRRTIRSGSSALTRLSSLRQVVVCVRCSLRAYDTRLLRIRLAIWEKYKESFCDDLWHRLITTPNVFPPSVTKTPLRLWPISLRPRPCGQQRTLTDVRLPQNIFDWSLSHASATRGDEVAADQERATDMEAQLNAGQKDCLAEILRAIADNSRTAHFYLQGPGGTGKTFLYKALCYKLKARERLFCVVRQLELRLCYYLTDVLHTPSLRSRLSSMRRPLVRLQRGVA